jgi:sporulation-control protein spo0M
MTLKKGYDVNGAKDAIIAKLYTLTDDDGNIVFPTGSILHGREGKLSLYKGLTCLFGIGDTKSITPGMRNVPSWGLHEAGLVVLEPGETDEVIEHINDLSRLIPLFIEENKTMDETGLQVTLPTSNPILRRSFTINGKTNKPVKCTGCLVNLDVEIARMPE